MGRLTRYMGSVKRYVIKQTIIFSIYHLQQHLARQRLVRIQMSWFNYHRTSHIRSFTLEKTHRMLRHWFTLKKETLAASTFNKSTRRMSIEFIFGKPI